MTEPDDTTDPYAATVAAEIARRQAAREARRAAIPYNRDAPANVAGTTTVKPDQA